MIFSRSHSNTMDRCKNGDLWCCDGDCLVCHYSSAANLPLSRSKCWNKQKNVISDPRKVPLDISGKWWFTCMTCDGDIFCTMRTARDNEEWCNGCYKPPMSITATCQQGHLTMGKHPCIRCHPYLETRMERFLSGIYNTRRRPTFPWSMVNGNGEYISYNFLIRGLMVLIEITNEGQDMEPKYQRATQNGYTIICVGAVEFEGNTFDYKVAQCTPDYHTSLSILYPHRGSHTSSIRYTQFDVL
jgi:hypothetical protein